MFSACTNKATQHSCSLPPFTERKKQLITAQFYSTPFPYALFHPGKLLLKLGLISLFKLHIMVTQQAKRSYF